MVGSARVAKDTFQVKSNLIETNDERRRCVP